MTTPEITSHLRTCSFCEATCGIVVEMEGARVRRVRGDREHPDSRGFLCPKASAVGWLHDDPDRLRHPLVRRGTSWEAVDWDDAFALVDERLTDVLGRFGRDSLGLYVGNPASYDIALSLYGPPVYRVARQRYSPATVDTFPKQMANGLVYGGEFTIPFPDLGRTDVLWILGANPAASNGSLLVAPDVMGRLERIQGRGGRVVVFDPRRTATAQKASEHRAIRPGTDAMFLAAVITTLFDEGLVRLRHLGAFTTGIEELRRALAPLSPRVAGPACGIDADDIVALAREFAAADAAVAYGRLGTCTQEFGTLASWLIEALNVLTGNLDRPGGAMFGWPATGSELTGPGPARTPRRGRWTSRVRGAPEVMGELPVACLAEEITTPGPGQLRALLTVAGNPVLSVPDHRLAGALEQLDLHIALDLYLNETTSRADIVLPAESPLQRPHFPHTQLAFMAHQVVRWTEPTLAPDGDRPRDWQVMLRLHSILSGRGLDPSYEELDDELFRARVETEVRQPGSRLAGRSVDEIVARADGDGPARLIDLMLRAGPYGDAYGAAEGISLAAVRAHPHGLVVGSLEPRLPGALRTTSGCIELAPPALVDEVPKLAAALTRPAGTRLIGRRDLRTNNSWMHNVAGLARGKDRSRLLLHPHDAAIRQLETGDRARLRGAHHEVVVEVEIDEAMMPGVVSLPHGWGHDHTGTRLSVAEARPGVNANLLADHDLIDPLSGSSVVNGIDVELLAGCVE